MKCFKVSVMEDLICIVHADLYTLRVSVHISLSCATLLDDGQCINLSMQLTAFDLLLFERLSQFSSINMTTIELVVHITARRSYYIHRDQIRIVKQQIMKSMQT